MNEIDNGSPWTDTCEELPLRVTFIASDMVDMDKRKIKTRDDYIDAVNERIDELKSIIRMALNKYGITYEDIDIVKI